MPSNPKPVRMWGWTNSGGDIVAVSSHANNWKSWEWLGTRIRVVVTPAKKGRKK